jgi:hypothetical protein
MCPSDNFAPFLGVESLGDLGRSNNIGEQDGNGLSFSSDFSLHG